MITTDSTILVVDDQPDLVDNLEITLEVAGYRVLTAPDGVEALKILHADRVDLVLADIAMPRMNGYQLYEEIRDNPAWLTMPFLFLTARSLDSDVRYGKELGVDDYLTKPIEPEDLLATVSGKLRRARQLSGKFNGGGTTPTPPPPPAKTNQPLVVGALRMDLEQHRAWLHDKPLQLSAREFILLSVLAKRANLVVAPQDLIRATHGMDFDHEEASTLLRPLVRTVRRKLGYPVGEMGCIEVVRSVGYRLTPPK